MIFEPDIIVTGPEPSDVMLVVEVKTTSGHLDNAERQLTKYMAAMRSPVGMLVTPEKLWLYRDQYLSTSEESIKRVGEFDVGNILRFDAERGNRNVTVDFENTVQTWIEGLTTESGLRGLPPDLRRAVQSHIVPAISQGIIRAGHPRPSSIA
jgi:hypothetical protein